MSSTYTLREFSQFIESKYVVTILCHCLGSHTNLNLELLHCLRWGLSCGISMPSAVLLHSRFIRSCCKISSYLDDSAGSSREFTGFDVGTRNEVLECIMRQASKFLPALADVSLQQAIGSGRVRTGLRPYGWFQTFQLYSLIHRKNWTGL